MKTNAHPFFHDPAAPGARLRGIGGVYGNHFATSLFHFVAKELLKHGQAGVMRAECQVSVSGHETEGEVFDRDQTELVGQLSGGLVPEVPALVGDTLMKSGYGERGLSPAATSLLATRQATLGDAEFLLIFPQPAGVLQEGAIAESQEGLQAHVNADGWTVFFQGKRCVHLQGKADIPIAQVSLEDDVFDDGPLRDGPVILHFDLARILDIEEGASIVLTELAPISIAELQAMKPLTAFKSREAGLFSSLESSEEGLEGLIQSAEHLLDRGGVELAQGVGIFPAEIPEVTPLIDVGCPLASLFVGGNSLLQSRIVERPPLPKEEVKGFGLPCRG